MPRWKKISLAIALIAVSIFAFLTWYKIHYSMDVAESFEITAEDPTHQILIATQGSEFKNAIVTGVIEALDERPISIKVIDVTGLASVNTEDWSAFVILHTWESFEPQAVARSFLEHQPNLDKFIVLTTSGGGAARMDQVDAITSASAMADVSMHIDEIVHRINRVLGQQTGQ